MKTIKQALVERRNEDICSLDCSYLPDHLQDEEYCSSVVEQLYDLGKEWEMLAAVKTTYNRIPNTPGLYMFVWKPYFQLRHEESSEYMRVVLYVGKAGDGASTLRSRYRTEYSKYIKSESDVYWKNNKMNSRDERLKHILNLWELEYWFLSVREYTNEIERLEKKLIEIFNPPGNSSNKRKKIIVATTGKAKPAF